MHTQTLLDLRLPVITALHPFKAAALARRIEPGWQRHAACLEATDAESWFPDETTGPADLAGPLAACARCPVTRSCLAAGLLGDEHGLWGGTTRDQRRQAHADIAAGAPTAAILDNLLDALDARVETSEPAAA